MTDNRTDTQKINTEDLSTKNKNANTTTVTVDTAQLKENKPQNQTITTPSSHESKADIDITSKNSSKDDRIVATDKSSYNTKHDLPPIDKVEGSMTSKNDSSNKQKAELKTPEPQIKKFDIIIAGATYAIYCPAEEEAELRAAESYLNAFASDIKKEAPKLNQENLLVLSCLNLYEQINTNKVADVEQQQQHKQNEHLLNKIMQEAQSIL